MIQTVRWLGFGLIALGAILLLVWAIEPLRFLWPWFRVLPGPVQLGLGAALLGLLVLIASLIAERVEERKEDLSLQDDVPDRRVDE